MASCIVYTDRLCILQRLTDSTETEHCKVILDMQSLQFNRKGELFDKVSCECLYIQFETQICCFLDSHKFDFWQHIKRTTNLVTVHRMAANVF